MLHSIKKVADAAARAGKPVSVCGEMAGDPMNALLLLGLGVQSLSLSAPNIPRVKEAIRRSSREQAGRIADQVLSMVSAEEIALYLAEVRKDLGL
jgi:phosphotransferase system, enzyme I, PtsP